MIDEAGFESFYRRPAAPLRGYVVRTIGSAASADDIVQEAFLRLLRAPPPTDDPEQVRAYLFRIAGNLVRDHWRKMKRDRRSTESYVHENDPVPDDASQRLDMTRVFEQLRPQQRQLMWLAYVEGADHREIAAALGVGERSVRVLLHRARRKLAALLRERETT